MLVFAAIMPQPMSTPTAAGMIALSVGMHEPTVAPNPKWQSGITATCLKMNGISERLCICCSATSSICSCGTQESTLGLSECGGIVSSPNSNS